MYNEIEIKQYSKATYLGCLLDETMSDESMTLKTIKKINQKLKFLHRKNRFLTSELRWLNMQCYNTTTIWLRMFCMVPKFNTKTKKGASSYVKQMYSLLSSIEQNVQNFS